MATHRNRNAAAMIIAALVFALGSVSVALPAEAAPITGALINVTVTPAAPALNSQIKTDITWCIPNGTMAGDTFTLALSPYLRFLPSGFDLPDGIGGPNVATAVINSSSPATVTFTMTAYAQSHVNVCGTAFIQSTFDGSLTPGVPVPFTNTANDGTSWTTAVTPTPALSTGTEAKAFKFGGFASSDQGHTNPTDAVRWFIVSPEGPLDSTTISDTVDSATTIDCSSALVQIGDRTATNISSISSSGITVITPIACTPTSISVKVGPLAAGKAVRLTFVVSLAAATGPASHTFHNSAQVVSVRSGVTQTDPLAVTLKSSTAGGTGTGDVPTGQLVIHKELAGPGAAFGSGNTLVFHVLCTLLGSTTYSGDITLAVPPGATSVTSPAVVDIAGGSSCTITETSAGAADAAASPVTVVIPASTTTASPVIASLTNHYSAATISVSKSLNGDAAAVAAQTSTKFGVLVTCQILEGATLSTVYSGTVLVTGGQTVMAWDSAGAPILLPVGTHCFAAETDKGAATFSAINYSSFSNAAIVTAGSATSPQSLLITVANTFRDPSAVSDASVSVGTVGTVGTDTATLTALASTGATSGGLLLGGVTLVDAGLLLFALSQFRKWRAKLR